VRLGTLLLVALGLFCLFMLGCALADHVLNWLVENTTVGRMLAIDMDLKKPPIWDSEERKFIITKFVWEKLYGAILWAKNKLIDFIYWLAGLYEGLGIPPPYSDYAAAGTVGASGVVLVAVVARRWFAI